MEQHKTLELLMRTLFANNCLKTWSIFEENSGNIVLKIRFTKTDNSQNENSNNVIKSASYKRKSSSQTQRDRERALRHHAARDGVTTRSQAAVEYPEIPRHSEEISHSYTRPLEYTPVLNSPALDPEALCFEPEPLNCVGLSEDTSTKAGDIVIPSLDSSDTANNFEVNEEPSADAEDMQICTDAEPCIACFKCSVKASDHHVKTTYCVNCENYVCQLCFLKTRHFEQCPSEHPIRYIDT